MAQNDNLKSHEHTYDRMIGVFKWGTGVVVGITAIVIWLIAT